MIKDLFYEYRPYGTAAIGMYALLNNANSKVMIACGALLLYCAIQIYYWRSVHRRA